MILIDTHIWIWWVSKQEALRESERKALDAAGRAGGVALASISMWEVQLLHAKGRLDVHMSFAEWLPRVTRPPAVRLLPLDVPVVLALNELPATFHGDPADRIIAATARAYDLPLATYDRAILNSGAVRLWSA